MKYELEYQHIPGSGHESVFCTLTGLPLEEVKPYCKKIMKGQEFIKGFRSLGFNTNDRFIKFDKNTQSPVLLRCKGDIESHWYSFVYYDGTIWDPHNNEFYNLNDVKDMRYFKRKYYFTQYRLRITSMLQVWILK